MNGALRTPFTIYGVFNGGECAGWLRDRRPYYRYCDRAFGSPMYLVDQSTLIRHQKRFLIR